MFFPEKSKLAKDLKKEITKVRRQLALQKGAAVMSETEDSKSMCTTGKNGTMTEHIS